MKIRPFYLLLLIFVIAYILLNSPIHIYPTIIFYQFPFLNNILQAYIVCFAIFLFIKNYDQIKVYFSRSRSSVLETFVDKNNEIKTDVCRFIIVSLLITFFLDVALTKIAEQPVVEYIVELIPGSDFVQKYVPTAYNATQVINENADFSKFFNFGAVKSALFYLPGLPIGILVIFILRQLRYKSKKKAADKYPGGTILLVFLIAVPIALSLDISAIMQGKAPAWSAERSGSVTGFRDQFSVTVYGLKEFSEFSLKYLVNPVYYVAALSAWIFDWYLFSRIWVE
jgi:hypothetical protein